MTRLKDSNTWQLSKQIFWIILGIITFIAGVDIAYEGGTWFYWLIGLFFTIISFYTVKEAIHKIENIDWD